MGLCSMGSAKVTRMMRLFPSRVTRQMNRNVRKSNDCISVGKEEKLMRINSLTLVQFPSAINIGMKSQLWSQRFLIGRVRFWICFQTLSQCQEKSTIRISVVTESALCYLRINMKKKEWSLSSEMGNVSSFPTLTLYDPFSILLPYLLKQLGSYLYTFIFCCTFNTFVGGLSETGPETVEQSQVEKQQKFSICTYYISPLL